METTYHLYENNYIYQVYCSLSLSLFRRRTWDVLFLWQHLPKCFADMLRQLIKLLYFCCSARKLLSSFSMFFLQFIHEESISGELSLNARVNKKVFRTDWNFCSCRNRFWEIQKSQSCSWQILIAETCNESETLLFLSQLCWENLVFLD